MTLRRLVFVAVSLLATVALARAGSGESFSSHSSSSGGGGGLGDAFGGLFALIGCPLLALIVLVQVGVGVARSLGKEPEQRQKSEIIPPEQTFFITETDPTFRIYDFADKVRRDFARIQEAWFRRNLDPVRDVLSDSSWQRLATQLALLHRQGVRDAIADLGAVDFRIVRGGPAGAFDFIEVELTASLRDSEVPATASDDEARAAAMQTPPSTFTEYWTFLRSKGVTTKERTGCPSCGAPFEGNATAQCTHCSAILNSGQFDWVLAEITQAEVHAQPSSLPKLAALEARDPGFSTAVLEDRASLIFWKWVAAQDALDPAALAKVSTPRFFEGLRLELDRRTEQHSRWPLRDVAVGAVETRALEPLPDFDVAACEVTWSSMGVRNRSVLVLKRRAGATSDPKRGLSTARCPSCSAPLSDNGQPTCEFCGEALAANASDWVLDEFLSWESWGARARSVAPPPVAAPSGSAPAVVAVALPPEAPEPVMDFDERVRLLQLLARVSRVDGTIDALELEHLRTLASRWGVPFESYEPALVGTVEPPWPASSPEAEFFLRQLVDLCLVDGVLRAEESKTLSVVALRLGLSPRLKGLIAERQLRAGVRA